MKRWLVFLFALLLPVQFAWAGMSVYCQHETAPVQKRHFGHHEHVHHASTEPGGASKLAGDADCGTCQAAGSGVLFDDPASLAVVRSTGAVVPHPPRRIPTALARAPDRPQWLRLA